MVDDADDRFLRVAFDARTRTPITSTRVDLHYLRYNHPNLAEVCEGYLRHTNPDTKLDFDLVREANPLQPFIETLERRHR